MVFAWDLINRDHIARHQISPQEAEAVVNGAQRPYPQYIEEDKLVVRGATDGGRLLQVIYVLKKPAEVSYESLSVEEWMAVESGEVTEVIRVIHAMDLSPKMKHRLRRQWRNT